jgi:hypothetical protein
MRDRYRARSARELEPTIKGLFASSWRSSGRARGRRELHVFRDLAVFVRDHVGTSADAFVADFAAIARDEPKDLIVGFSAERAVTVAHGMPHSLFGADSPRWWSADLMTVYVLGGNFWRNFHIGTTDGLSQFANSATAFAPPSFSMTSSTV